jgi:hypothetical protein
MTASLVLTPTLRSTEILVIILGLIVTLILNVILILKP